MKHSTKLLLFIVGGFATLFVVVVVVGVIWVSRGGSGVMQQALHAAADGKRLGALIEARACVDTAFARHARREGLSIMGSAAEHVFIRGCLDASRPTPSLCDSVPRPIEIMRAASWASRACRDRGFDDVYCPGIAQELSAYCGRKRVT